MSRLHFRKMLFTIGFCICFLVIFPKAISADVTDDTYELNNTFETAKNITLGNTTNLYLADDDWFKFYTAFPGELKINVTFSGNQNELEFELKTDLNVTIANGDYFSWSINKDIWTNVGGYAWLYLRIYRGITVNPSIPYSLNINFIAYTTSTSSTSTTTTSSTSNSDDTFEQNDVFNDAKNITLGFTSNLLLMDDDWFKFYTSSPGQLVINVSFTGNSGDLQYDLLTDSSNIIANGQKYPWSTNLDILTNVGGSAWLYLHIKMVNSSSISIPYSIRIEFTPTNNSNSTSDSDGISDDTNNNFENPFSNIIGYPGLFTVPLFILTINGLIFSLKKRTVYR